MKNSLDRIARRFVMWLRPDCGYCFNCGKVFAWPSMSQDLCGKCD